MQYSDTTNKNGLLQVCEFWTGIGDAGISGNTTRKAQFTARLNAGFDRVLPRVLSYSKSVRWDDTNHTDHPFGTFALVSGQNDYNITEDDNNLDILNIVGVKILPSATSTEYLTIDGISADHVFAERAMSPNPSDTGVPIYYLEANNTLFFYPEPNYSAAAGVKIFFEREPSYFATTDTTKEPGIPKPFHELLALYASHDWVVVNKPENTVLITRLEAQIARRERELDDLISKRNPQRRRLTGYSRPPL